MRFKFTFQKEYKRVLRANDRAAKAYLNRTGGLLKSHVKRFVVKRAPLNKRLKSGKLSKSNRGRSRPGQPPIARVKQGYKDIKRLKHDVNMNNMSVIIGPTGYVSDAVEALEKGKMVKRKAFAYDRATKKRRMIRVKFKLDKRPFMRVGYNKIRPIIAQIYAEESRKMYRRMATRG